MKKYEGGFESQEFKALLNLLTSKSCCACNSVAAGNRTCLKNAKEGRCLIYDKNADILTKLEEKEYPSFLYQRYEYQASPLIFMECPDLTQEQMMHLLLNFITYYGNMDHNKTLYALELSILIINLIHDSALVINPHYLEITAVLDEIVDVLPEAFGSTFRSAVDAFHGGN